MERCIQCGHSAAQHPMVAVAAINGRAIFVNGDWTAYEDIPAEAILATRKDGQFVACAMCAACHREPKIKAHFFARPAGGRALAAAGADSLGGF
jgi:Zn ribbon nucleic-acid-binding protein